MKPILTFLILAATLNAGLCAQSLDSVIQLIREGRNAQARQQIVQLQKKGETPDVYLFLHGLVSTSGDSALIYYQTLLDQYPKSHYADDALFRIAQLNYAKGLYVTAKSDFLKALTLKPNASLHANCLYWAALCFQALNQKDSAAVYLRSVTQQFPQSAAAANAKRLNASEPKTPAPAAQPLPQKKQTIYAVQVGAFSHQSNALLRKSFFEKKGYPVTLHTKLRHDQTLYVVWVGNCTTRTAAIQLRDQIRKRYSIDCALVSENR